ncbi:NAD-dependent protein deacetylase [bacterium HR19]|nr:NAD-dependent protein deacetylase [bacterium HR19]
MDDIERAVEIISRSEYVIAFTGAGVSAESGIPTFRDKGGLWERFPAETFGVPSGLLGLLFYQPSRLSEFIKAVVEVIERAKPNKGHIALAELEKLGILKCVITQNIDYLHQEAGNKEVIEVHGSITRLRCIICRERKTIEKKKAIEMALEFAEKIKSIDLSSIIEKGEITLEEIKEKFGGSLPVCDYCGGIMRPDIVFFTEPVQDLDIAIEKARRSDCCIIAGTSGVVYPAAYIPQIVKMNKGTLIEINPNSQCFPSDIYISDSFANAMEAIARKIKEKVIN